MTKKAAAAQRTRQARAAMAPEAAPAPAKRARTSAGGHVSRSAKTGRIVSADEAAKNPDTTVTEKVSKPKKGKLAFAIPKTFGAAADMLYETRQKRLDIQKEVDRLENIEKALKEHFINSLSKKDSTGAAGKLARVQLVQEDIPVAQDWDALYAYIKKTGNFELLNRALNRSAAKERWANKKEIPGVGHFTATKVSVNKI